MHVRQPLEPLDVPPRQTVATVYDPGGGMEHRRVINHCVSCRTPLSELWTPSGRRLECCGACGGAWLEVADFLMMLREAQPQLVVDELAEHNDGEPRRPCPTCGDLMSFAWLGYLRLEQCSDHGVWCDTDELAGALSGDIAAKNLVVLVPPKKRRR